MSASEAEPESTVRHRRDQEKMAQAEKQIGTNVDYDVVIVGAGISGVNAAYRVQQDLPHLSYTILESRDALGGTWAFFKYPGIRSDSEIASFAFSWAPWEGDKVIADGPSILRYVEKTAHKFGIDRHIQFNTRVTHLDWQYNLQKWRITTSTNSTESMTLHARFVILCTGYYDYTTPYQASIPGLSDFSGKIVHPQSWPTDLDYTDQNIVVLGSGATAATLVPALSQKAKHVTMLQRSPSFYLVIPTTEALDDFTRRVFPAKLAYALIRFRVLIIAFVFVQLCYLLPKQMTKLLRKGVAKELPPDHALDPHFTPKYDPFVQRLCFIPDGDFFHAIRTHKAHVETDEIESITGRTITLKSGKALENVDLLVTATGLQLRVIDKIPVTVDSSPVTVSTKYTWRGACIQDVPNLCYMLGYTDAAWTLGSDSTARMFVRMIKRVEKKRCASFVPDIPDKEGKKLKDVPMLNLSSGYIMRSVDQLPKTASAAPWSPRWSYAVDYWFAGYGNIEKGIKFVKGP